MRRFIPHRDSPGFTMIELLVVIAVLALLTLWILPRHSRVSGTRFKCVNNLKNISLAFRIFAGDNEDKFPMSMSANQRGSREFSEDPAAAFRHFQVLSNELSTPKILHCPKDTRKEVESFPALKNENISYFLGLDARVDDPALFLSGDRNLTKNGKPLGRGLFTLDPQATFGWTKEFHNLRGNVALADGSVQQLSGSRLDAVLRQSTNATQRIVTP